MILTAAARQVTSYRRCISMMWTAARTALALAAMLATFCALLQPTRLWLTKGLIDRLVPTGETGGMPGSGIDVLTYAIVLALIAASVAAWIADTLAEHMKTVVSLKTVEHTRHLIARTAVGLDVAFFDDPASHDALSNALANDRTAAVAPVLIAALQQVAGLMGVLWLLAGLHVLAPLFLLMACLPEGILLAKCAGLSYSCHEQHSRERRLAAYFLRLCTTREHAQETRVYGLGPSLVGGFLHSLGLAMAPVLEVERRRSRLRVGGSAISGLGVLATAAYTVTQAQAAHITVGDAQMFIGAAVGAAVSVRGLVYTGLGLYENGLFLLDLVTFLDRGQSHAHVIQPAAPAPRARVSTDKDIRFEHVSFAYPGARRRAISDVSFVVPSGSTVALVGRNGAGKTTLVSLLTRMYEPTHGRILFDGVDIREHDVDELRARFGVVYQDFTRYALTARHNVGYGDVERMYDDRHLDAAARRAGIRDIVLQLPKQWDSYLGCLFEEGVDLSLGEWQRMALARALVREPEILVLDEPSASLDPIAEQGLDREYLGLRQGCTVLMISHRLRNVRAADNILVLDAGAIAEAGSHRELMARHGLYEALFTAQARAYAP